MVLLRSGFLVVNATPLFVSAAQISSSSTTTPELSLHMYQQMLDTPKGIATFMKLALPQAPADALANLGDVDKKTLALLHAQYLESLQVAYYQDWAKSAEDLEYVKCELDVDIGSDSPEKFVSYMIDGCDLVGGAKKWFNIAGGKKLPHAVQDTDKFCKGFPPLGAPQWMLIGSGHQQEGKGRDICFLRKGARSLVEDLDPVLFENVPEGEWTKRKDSVDIISKKFRIVGRGGLKDSEIGKEVMELKADLESARQNIRGDVLLKDFAEATRQLLAKMAYHSQAGATYREPEKGGLQGFLKILRKMITEKEMEKRDGEDADHANIGAVLAYVKMHMLKEMRSEVAPFLTGVLTEKPIYALYRNHPLHEKYKLDKVARLTWTRPGAVSLAEEGQGFLQQSEAKMEHYGFSFEWLLPDNDFKPCACEMKVTDLEKDLHGVKGESPGSEYVLFHARLPMWDEEPKFFAVKEASCLSANDAVRLDLSQMKIFIQDGGRGRWEEPEANIFDGASDITLQVRRNFEDFPDLVAYVKMHMLKDVRSEIAPILRGMPVLTENPIHAVYRNHPLPEKYQLDKVARLTWTIPGAVSLAEQGQGFLQQSEAKMEHYGFSFKWRLPHDMYMAVTELEKDLHGIEREGPGSGYVLFHARLSMWVEPKFFAVKEASCLSANDAVPLDLSQTKIFIQDEGRDRWEEPEAQIFDGASDITLQVRDFEDFPDLVQILRMSFSI